MIKKETKIYNNKIIKDRKFNQTNLDDLIFKWGKIDLSNFQNSSLSNSDVGEGLIENSNFINSKQKSKKLFMVNFQNIILKI